MFRRQQEYSYDIDNGIPMRFKTYKFFAAAALLFLATATARAEWLTFEVHWVSPHGYATRADGQVTIDVTKRADGSYSGGADADTVRNFSLTVSNAMYGNGTFTELVGSDYDGMYLYPGWVGFHAAAGIDLTKDLIGQPQFQVEDVGPHGANQWAGFLLFGPLGRGFYYQTTSRAQWWQGHDHLMLSSLKVLDYYVAPTPVPEPQVLAMMLAGMGLVTVAARRRRAQPSA